MNKRDKVFVLTGAGISAESGLPTFRSTGGLWSGPIVEEVCTPTAWEQDSWKVWQFYSMRRSLVLSANPNPAHIALAELEAKLGDRFFLCTQNVDDLHEKAGSKRMVHLHGEIKKSRCSARCGLEPVEDLRVYRTRSEVPRCVCGALMRPHVVFFEESPIDLERVEDELYSSTLMIVVGTSGTVKPAANLVSIAKRWQLQTIYAGLEKPKNSSKFSEIILGKAGDVVPRFSL